MKKMGRIFNLQAFLEKLGSASPPKGLLSHEILIGYSKSCEKLIVPYEAVKQNV